MAGDTVRSTLYLDPALHQALRLKAVSAHRSMSDIVNDAIRAALREDEQDLAAFAERAGEKTLSYEDFLSQLKADGTGRSIASHEPVSFPRSETGQEFPVAAVCSLDGA